MSGCEPEPVRLVRLLPASKRETVTAAGAAAGLDFAAAAPAERPYVVVNMVATVDGRATVQGRTGSIGNRADRELFHALRTRVDAVLVGAGTVRSERYGRLVRQPARQELRRAAGLEPEPLAVVVTRSLRLPPDLPLLADPDARVIVATASEGDLPPTAASVQYLRGEGGALDMGEVFRRLRTDWGVRSLLCEGGPELNGALLPAGLVDELFLSIAPKLAAGAGALSIVSSAAPEQVRDLELRWLLESEGHLFARYAFRPEPATAS